MTIRDPHKDMEAVEQAGRRLNDAQEDLRTAKSDFVEKHSLFQAGDECIANVGFHTNKTFVVDDLYLSKCKGRWVIVGKGYVLTSRNTLGSSRGVRTDFVFPNEDL